MTGKEIVPSTIFDNGNSKITQIRGAAEQQAFRLLRHLLPPQAVILYEPCIFMITDHDGKTHSTIPDFIIKMSNERIIILEITTQSRNGTDPKAKQRRIMMEAAPRIPYKVWYAENLDGVACHHPDLFSLKAKKIRKSPLEPLEISPQI